MSTQIQAPSQAAQPHVLAVDDDATIRQLIAVSGHFGSGQGTTPQDAMNAGAARALAKPVKRAELLGAVAELIGPPKK